MEEDLNKLKVIKRRRKSIVRSNIPNFNSVYAKILYLELEKRKPSTDLEISLEELKHILMVPNLAYVYSHLRLRVLDSIMKEFNEVNSPLQFSYEIVKKNEKDIVKFKTKYI
ncbi:replication initiation protein [Clostridium algidicarnis]|uniref:replication initiation protein n=1 Tax=Clostridium algidicarnis TaxID=37659 RepID=UPI001C0B9D99|nr:replication initiation protein [Clostridium algidicarnis]MBU3210566.1 replication initiation protein [Clostridium algidicarnis]MBU3228224.1 replication initiation protein [Clostridium algidicarnis]MBU3252108.1 replication initiation protein [Clostridium algidicarnis]